MFDPITPRATFPSAGFSGHRRLLPLMLLLSLSCAPSTRVAYRIHVPNVGADSVLVDLQIDGAPRHSLVLRAYAATEVLGLSRFEARAANGRPVPTLWSSRVVAGGRAEAVRIELTGPLPRSLHVRYQVAPTRREGSSHTGFTGRSFGEVGDSGAFFQGSNLFLVPEPAERLRDVAVDFDVPAGWSIVTPWSGGRRPGIQGSFAAEDLVAATIAVGRFRVRQFVIGRTRYELRFDSRISPVAERLATERLTRVARYLHSLFGRDLGPVYRVSVLPSARNGDDLIGDGWADGQGGTLVPATTDRVHRFAERLIDAYLVAAPYRPEMIRPSEYWVTDGVRRLYAWRALVRSGLMTDDDVAQGAAFAYLALRQTPGIEADLEHLYDSSTVNAQPARDYDAPAALLSLDTLIRKTTSNAECLDDIVRRLYRGHYVASLWRVLPPAPPGTWERFRAENVLGVRHLNTDAVPALQPTEERPRSGPGRTSRRIVVAYTGDSYGFLEHCGCKVNQSGGVARRATVLKRIRSRTPDLLLIDAGNTFPKPENSQAPTFLAAQEQRLYLRTMDRMRYDAASVGSSELMRGPASFQSMTRGIRTPFLSSNVSGAAGPLAPGHRIVLRQGVRIGVIGVLERPHGRFVSSVLEQSLEQVTICDPVKTLAREARVLRDSVDLLIAIGDLSPAIVRKIAQSGAPVDVVISSSAQTPTLARVGTRDLLESSDQPGFLGRLLVLYTSVQQYGLQVSTLDLDSARRVVGANTRIVMLGEDVPDDPGTRQALTRFYRAIGSTQEAQRSVRTPFEWDASRMSGRYIGAARCRRCHEDEYLQWEGTAHADAYKTLLERHRQIQPVCVSCHVVGYGTAAGYHLGDGERPLGDVQCEVCHGPGADHQRKPGADNIQKEVPERVCLECHNPDHSDRFVYAEKIKRVRHDEARSALLNEPAVPPTRRMEAARPASIRAAATAGRIRRDP